MINRHLCLTFVLSAMLVISCTHVRDLGKLELDKVGDATIVQLETKTREISKRLYQMNPEELKKAGVSLDARLQQIVEHPLDIGYIELQNKRGVAVMELALDASFPNDRVFALMSGISGMIKLAFNQKREFFATDRLEAQKLYNAARNLEILSFRLNKTVEGKTLLKLGTETGPDSFSWYLGETAGVLDLVSTVVEGRGGRILRTTSQAAAAALLPIY